MKIATAAFIIMGALAYVALPWDTRTADTLQRLFDDPAMPPTAEPPEAPHMEL